MGLRCFSIRWIRVDTPPFLFFLLNAILIILLSSAAVSYAGKANKSPATQRPYVINNRMYSPLPSAIGYDETGLASWYGSDFHGRPTSNGETYNMHDITAAHKLLPMHTILLVTNLDNGMETVVRVNDRGPFIQGRIIDLSYGAAQKIGLVKSGIARVKVTALGEVGKDKANGRKEFRKIKDLKSGEYYVQIGAFIEKYNGKKLQERFLSAGHHTVVRKVKIDGKLYYQVQVYVGKTLDSARRSEQALLDKGYNGAFVLAR